MSPLGCPFRNCTQHRSSRTAQLDSPDLLRDHLRDLHRSELHLLNDSTLEQSSLYVCRHCDSEVFVRENDLDTHIRRYHCKTRDKSNLELASEFIYDEFNCPYPNQWEAGLSWITRQYTSSPPPFRQSLINKIKYKLEDHTLTTFASLIHTLAIASRPPKNARDASNVDFSSTPFWILLLIFEQLVLAPLPQNTTDKVTPSIKRRLHLFQSGQLQLLYQESRQIHSHTKSHFRTNPPRVSNSSQAAADLDNYRTAHARLNTETPIAAINDSNDHILFDLHPAPHTRVCNKKRRSRRSTRNKPRIHLSPSDISTIILHLHRGKAPGIEVDSLDIFIKLVRFANKTKCPTSLPITEDLAFIFSSLLNGEIPSRIKTFLRTTYLVALQKDPDDPTKLRPLGIPAALRRIAASIILFQHKHDFASFLLPFNFAIGISGGLDFITHTVRIGVQRFITDPQSNGNLPSRALVSLDLRNMFNSISRHKLREIIAEEFPALEPFIDTLYEEDGATKVKRDDGTWFSIPVREGFSQGCPLSPVLSSLVLHCVLSHLSKLLKKRADDRKKQGTLLDDNAGGVTITLAYLDDVNFLVPHEDLLFLLTTFQELGAPLGAIMNTDKTRILTSTNHKSIIQDLTSSNPTLASEVQTAINLFSTKSSPDGTKQPFEVTDGLRILGSPIGSRQFCTSFLLRQLTEAKLSADKILSNLDDAQTMLRLFKTCTVHKLTHLFASDVALNFTPDNPPHWMDWTSDLSSNFTTMSDNFLASLTQQETLPQHASIMASISTKAGGLGLQNPSTSAVPTFVLTMKKCLSFALDGIPLGTILDAAKLPPSISAIYSSWKTSNLQQFQAFRCYLPTMSTICNGPTAEDPLNHFIFRLSNTHCRNEIKLARSKLLRRRLETEFPHLRDLLPDLMERRISLALMTMSRLNPKHRMRNDNFIVNIQRKLRLDLWPADDEHICICGKPMDPKGDHCLGCPNVCKTPAHNSIRDGIIEIMKRILTTVRLTYSAASVERELLGIIHRLPSKRPFDWSFRLDHVLHEMHWHCSLKRIGFDVTITNPSVPKSFLKRVQHSSVSLLRLQKGELDKFERKRGGSDDFTGHTLTGDQIIGDIIRDNSAFVPISISPWGRCGPLFERFLCGSDSQTLTPNKPHAKLAADIASKRPVPKGILSRANTLWKEEDDAGYYGFSHMARDPSTWADQQLGLTIAVALSNHILRCYHKVKSRKAAVCRCDDVDHNASINSFHFVPPSIHNNMCGPAI